MLPVLPVLLELEGSVEEPFDALDRGRVEDALVGDVLYALAGDVAPAAAVLVLPPLAADLFCAAAALFCAAAALFCAAC